MIASAVAEIEQAERPQCLECADCSGDLTILVQRSDDVDPKSDEHDAIDESPGASEIGIGCPEEAISNDLDQRFNAEYECEPHVGPNEPVLDAEFVLQKVLSLV